MSRRRVVVTGVGAVSPMGLGSQALWQGLVKGRSGIVRHPGLEGVGGLRSLVAGLAPNIDASFIDRKFRRAMSAMSVFAVVAAREALAMAGVDPRAMSGEPGVCIGSTLSSPSALEEFFTLYLAQRSLDQVKSTMFFKVMGHSCAANVAQCLGITGRFLAPCVACATSCQAVGLGYESIAAGRQEMMLCGGADEIHPLTVATFDIIGAASTGYNDQPQRTPRPFDQQRDGTVCSEGCGVLLLESMESAQRRGVEILGEVCGFASLSDPSGLSSPDVDAIALCMRKTLEDASLSPADIDYVSMHATATEQGDIAESAAVHTLFGDGPLVSSLKGHLGHALAASGALELIASLMMMRESLLIPTLNLEQPDPRCAPLRYLRDKPTAQQVRTVIKNNFALGGVNSSLVVRTLHD